MQPTDPITNGQRLALNKLIGQFADSRDMRLWIVGQLIGRDVESTTDLTVAEWRTVRDAAYPHWPDDDWSVGEDFARTVHGMARDFRRDVLGQLEMF